MMVKNPRPDFIHLLHELVSEQRLIRCLRPPQPTRRKERKHTAARTQGPHNTGVHKDSCSYGHSCKESTMMTMGLRSLSDTHLYEKISGRQRKRRAERDAQHAEETSKQNGMQRATHRPARIGGRICGVHSCARPRQPALRASAAGSIKAVRITGNTSVLCCIGVQRR